MILTISAASFVDICRYIASASQENEDQGVLLQNVWCRLYTFFEQYYGLDLLIKACIVFFLLVQWLVVHYVSDVIRKILVCAMLIFFFNIGYCVGYSLCKTSSSGRRLPGGIRPNGFLQVILFMVVSWRRLFLAVAMVDILQQLPDLVAFILGQALLHCEG